MTSEIATAEALTNLEIGLDQTVNRILREEKELKEYFERLRLEDEEREVLTLFAKISSAFVRNCNRHICKSLAPANDSKTS